MDGLDFFYYNVDGLNHLTEDVQLYGSVTLHLDLISGFLFGDYLGKMKKIVRILHYPLTQVIQ